MNRTCNGHTFEVEGVTYYRCLFDGRTMAAVPLTGEPCFNCGREADVDRATVIRVRHKTIATIDLGSIGEVEVALGTLQTMQPGKSEAPSLEMALIHSLQGQVYRLTRRLAEMAVRVDRLGAQQP